MASNPQPSQSSGDAVASKLAALVASFAAKKAVPAVETHRFWPHREQIAQLKTELKATYREIADVLTSAGLNASAAQVTAFWQEWKGKRRSRSTRKQAANS